LTPVQPGTIIVPDRASFSANNGAFGELGAIDTSMAPEFRANTAAQVKKAGQNQGAYGKFERYPCASQGGTWMKQRQVNPN